MREEPGVVAEEPGTIVHYLFSTGKKAVCSCISTIVSSLKQEQISKYELYSIHCVLSTAPLLEQLANFSTFV